MPPSKWTSTSFPTLSTISGKMFIVEDAPSSCLPPWLETIIASAPVLEANRASSESNHGGRQLDGASSTINILPEIVDKVGKLVEVHIDGGIRSGQDVVKAMCLGAKGTYIGRAFLYGLGALGKQGVTKALNIIKTETDMTMALCGRRDIHDLNKDNIYTTK